jgi:hypothetical protein
VAMRGGRIVHSHFACIGWGMRRQCVFAEPCYGGHFNGGLYEAFIIALCAVVTVVALVAPASAVVLRWGETSDLPNGVLGIPETLSGGEELLFANPGNAGFDVVVKFSGSIRGGRSAYEALGTDQYVHFESSASNAIAWIEFFFYETGTTTPVNVLGFKTKFEDVERGNSTREWLIGPRIVSNGETMDLDFNDDSIFDLGDPDIDWGVEIGTKTVDGVTYAVAVPGYSVENGTQAGKTVGIDLSTTPLSYFRIGESRNSSSAGSVLIGPTLGNVVPEPTMLGLLGLGGLAFVRRRRAA